ncbi:MAG: outer membrane protein [Chitinophagaceae bacterium]
MRNIRNRIVPIFLLISFSFVNGFAQRNVPVLEIGAGLAGFVYQGDLTPEALGSFRTIRPGLVLSAGRVFSGSFIMRVNASFGGLRGDETKYDHPEFRRYRAFRFRTPVVEITPQLVWNLLGKNYRVKGISPYIFGGAGVGFFNTRRDHSDFNAAYFSALPDITDRIAEDDKITPSRVRFILPVGAGIRWSISESFLMTAESAYRFLFSDYLDGFSQAVNPDQNDHYHTISVGVTYRMGNKSTLACPVIRY